MSQSVPDKIDFSRLDSIRGIAALYVCIAHCRGILWIGGKQYVAERMGVLDWSDYLILGLNMCTRLSGEFVVVFFVLSGFSIAFSLKSNKSIPAFYLRRFIRLYPPYILTILWAGVVLYILYTQMPAFFDGTFQTLVFDRLLWSKAYVTKTGIISILFLYPAVTGILAPMWSLIQEVIFYLGAPFFYKRKNIYFAVSLVLFVIGLYMRALSTIEWNTILLYLFEYNFYFALGMYLHQYYEKVFTWLKAILSKTQTMFLLTGMYIVCIGISIWTGNAIVSSMIACMGSVGLIFYFTCYPVNLKPFRFLGEISYTLYISHVPTIYLYYFFLVKGQLVTPPYTYNNLLFIPAIGLSIAVAAGLYLLAEKPSKKILSGLRRR